MKKVAILTFGCKVNQYESEYMAEQLEKRGFVIVPEGADADYYIINSCVVTNTAVKKVHHLIRRIKRNHPESKVVVVGCYPQLRPQEPITIGADISLGNKEKKELWKYLSVYEKKEFVDRAYWLNDGRVETLEGGFVEKTRAFVKIEDGCDRACSYCAIRLARGSVIRSKKIEKVLSEIWTLVERGYKEIVLTGINLGRYGVDIGSSLGKLCQEIDKIEGDFRVRLSSLNPEDITEEIYQLFSHSERFCHHLHISLQSGSNRILKRMNRTYTREEFLEVVEKLRNLDKDFSITTDIIVGFPGETDEDFLQSVEMVKMVRFSKVHAFRYSPRKGTPAAKMDGHLPGNIKRERISYLEKVAKEVAYNYRKSLVGKEVTVFVERVKNGVHLGYDEYYILHEIPSAVVGEFNRVRILSANEEGVVSKRCS